jgi:hypothetical protein
MSILFGLLVVGALFLFLKKRSKKDAGLTDDSVDHCDCGHDHDDPIVAPAEPTAPPVNYTAPATYTPSAYAPPAYTAPRKTSSPKRSSTSSYKPSSSFPKIGGGGFGGGRSGGGGSSGGF